jgi:MFS family permease
MNRSNYKWWVVFMLWWVCFFNYADRQAISAVFPVLKEEFGLSPTQLGMIGSAFMWVYALGAPLAGFIGDRVRRKDLILGGCLFWSFVTITTGWCSKAWHFITVRALEGFGETFYFPASVSMTSDYHGPATRSRALAFHQSSVYLGTIAGSWLGAWLAEYYDWRYGFYIFGTAGMLLALLLYRFLREPQRGQSEDVPGAVAESPLSLPETLEAIVKHRAALLLMAAFFGANFIAMVFLTWTPTFLVEKFDYPLATAALYGAGFIQLASAVSVPLAGVSADWLAQRTRSGRIIVQGLGLFVGAGFIVLLGRAAETPTLIAAMVGFGFCKGFYDSGIFASLYDVIEPRARASAAGVMNTIGWAGGALGTLSFGLLAEHGRHSTEVDNMSEAIGWGSFIYLASALVLFSAAACLGPKSFQNAAEQQPHVH